MASFRSRSRRRGATRPASSRARSRGGRQLDLNGSKLWIGNGSFSEVTRRVRADAGGADGKTTEPGDGVHPAAGHAGVRAGPVRCGRWARGIQPGGAVLSRRAGAAENVLARAGRRVQDRHAGLKPGRQGLSAGAAGGVKQCLPDGDGLARAAASSRPAAGEYETIQGKWRTWRRTIYGGERGLLHHGDHDRGDVDYALESAAAKV